MSVKRAIWKVLIERGGSHIAGRIAGTYIVPLGDPLAIQNTGTLYPQGVFYFDPADYTAVNGVTNKLKLRVFMNVNDVAPTGNFTFGMYSVSRPGGITGGAGLNIYTVGAAVPSSTVNINAPAVDSMNQVVSSEFDAPAVAGWYCIGCITTATVAVNSHLHIDTQLLQINK